MENSTAKSRLDRTADTVLILDHTLFSLAIIALSIGAPRDPNEWSS